MMCELYKSDQMLCTNSAYLHYKDKQTNDELFVQQMSRPRDMCIRNIDAESQLWKTDSMRKATCFPLVNTRGGNFGCEPVRPCPKLYTSYCMDEFLLTPCPKNTYKNYIVFDDKKQCSKSHQILNNWTKRSKQEQEQ